MRYVAVFPVERGGMWDRAWKRPQASEPRFRPRIGREFDLEEVHVIDLRTRGFLSRVIAVGAGG
jgi:hypothetical protein